MLFSKWVWFLFLKLHSSKILMLSELPQPELMAQALNVGLVAPEHSQCLDSAKKQPAA